MRIFEPSPSINYDFISSMYFAFSALGTILYLLETQLFAPYKERTLAADADADTQAAITIPQLDIDVNSNVNVNANANANANVDVNTGDQEQSVLKELSESTAGLYLIFIPFIPCLFWSLVVRNNSKKRLSNDNGGTDTGTGNSSKRKED